MKTKNSEVLMEVISEYDAQMEFMNHFVVGMKNIFEPRNLNKADMYATCFWEYIEQQEQERELSENEGTLGFYKDCAFKFVEESKYKKMPSWHKNK